ncbi:hypothetical protein [Hydrogenimonas sp.]
MKTNRNSKSRRVWGFRPTTRIVESKKRYRRSRAKSEIRKEAAGL